jgi:hypothetical protein
MKIDAAKGLFVSDGCVVRKDSLLLALGFNSNPEQEYSRVGFHLEGQWRHFDVPTDAVVSVTANSELGYAMGSGGSIFELPLAATTTRDAFNERVRSWVIDSAVEYGELTRIRLIGETPYCCGQSGQIYRLGDGGWARADHGLRSDDDEAPDFEDLDGFGPAEIYAVGVGGALYRFDGHRWHRIESPTNVNISNIRCHSNGVCCACGDDGLIMWGRGDEWNLLGDPVPDKNYWGLEVFEEFVYVSHGKGIEKIVHGAVLPVALAIEGRTTFYRLHGRDGQLFSFGTDHLLKFSGGTWSRVEIPR